MKFQDFSLNISVIDGFSQQLGMQSSLLELPRRQSTQRLKVRPSQLKYFVSNHYQVQLNHKNCTIYQYFYETEPVIPPDSKDLLRHVLRNVKKELREKMSFMTFSGNMLWAVKKLEKPLSLKSQFKHENVQHSFDVYIKPAKTLTIHESQPNSQDMKVVFQFFNLLLKEKLIKLKMHEISRGKYFDMTEAQVKSVGLSVIGGYKFTMCQLKKGLALQIDVCSKVLRSKSLLEEINQMSREEIENLVGSTIITRYGKSRTYIISKMVFDKTPNSQFDYSKTHAKIRFADYYKESYGLSVKVMNQPMIEVCLRVEKRFSKQGLIDYQVIGFLIPEFVALTGMTDQQRKDFKTMRQIAQHTQLTPQQRMDKTNEIKKRLGDNEYFKLGNPIKIEGIQLNQPEVKLQTQSFRSKDGILKFNDRVKKSVPHKDWVLVYSHGKNSEFDDKEADDFVNLLKASSKRYGLNFSQPGFITTRQSIDSMKEQINKDIQTNGKPQIIAFLLNPHEEKYYAELKRYLICELQVNSQFIIKRTVIKSKNPMSAATMIALQMNQKIGGIAWQVQRKNGYLDNKKIMIGAFAISRGRRGYTLAFVGTINSECTKVITYCITGLKSNRDIPKAKFNTIFYLWAKNFVLENKEGPQIILVYRQGLSIPQIQVQVKSQIDALYDVIKKIGEKTYKPDYKCEVVYMTVNKNINARIFEPTDSNNHQGKFTPSVCNPPSGSCVFDDLSVGNLYDFHLTAQKVTNGTCTPTQYLVVHNDSKLPQEALAQLTYDQCFNYYNWQGAVKVPACMQNAQKLAKLVGESVHQDIVKGDIIKGFFFL